MWRARMFLRGSGVTYWNGLNRTGQSVAGKRGEFVIKAPITIKSPYLFGIWDNRSETYIRWTLKRKVAEAYKQCGGRFSVTVIDRMKAPRGLYSECARIARELDRRNE